MPPLPLAKIGSPATPLASAPAAPFSVVSEYANIAYAVVSQAAGVKHAPKEQIAFASTTTSDERLSFPSDYDYTLGLKLGVPNSWSTATSRTTSWEPLAKEVAPWFELRPSPLSVYSVELRYMRKITELTASTATPILDEQWHWALALKTAELLAAASERTTLEALNRARYTAYVNSVRLDQTRQRMDERGMHVAYVRKLR